MRTITFILLISLITIGCDKSKNKISDDDSAINPITIEEADTLITYWVFNDYNPSMNATFAFDSIIELTTDDILSKFKGQVFKAYSPVPGLWNRWFFIKNKKVYDLHHYEGQKSTGLDYDIIELTDLNNDEVFELCYIGYWGSGVVRSTFNCFYFIDDTVTNTLVKNFAENFLFPFVLQKENYQKLLLNYHIFQEDSIVNLGEIKLIGEVEPVQIEIELNDNLPEDIMNRLTID